MSESRILHRELELLRAPARPCRSAGPPRHPDPIAPPGGETGGSRLRPPRLTPGQGRDA